MQKTRSKYLAVFRLTPDTHKKTQTTQYGNNTGCLHSEEPRTHTVVLRNYCTTLLNPLLQISLKQLHQPGNSLKCLHNNCICQSRYLQATITSASQFPKMSLQQLLQPEYLSINQRKNKGNGRSDWPTILGKKLTKRCTSTRRYCVSNLVMKDLVI